MVDRRRPAGDADAARRDRSRPGIPLDYELIHAGFAIPVAVLLGAVALVLARRAVERDRATLGRAGGLRAARVGRLLGILGICLGATATVSLIVYGLLLAID